MAARPRLSGRRSFGFRHRMSDTSEDERVHSGYPASETRTSVAMFPEPSGQRDLARADYPNLTGTGIFRKVCCPMTSCETRTMLLAEFLRLVALYCRPDSVIGRLNHHEVTMRKRIAVGLVALTAGFVATFGATGDV